MIGKEFVVKSVDGEKLADILYGSMDKEKIDKKKIDKPIGSIYVLQGFSEDGGKYEAFVNLGAYLNKKKAFDEAKRQVENKYDENCIYKENKLIISEIPIDIQSTNIECGASDLWIYPGRE